MNESGEKSEGCANEKRPEGDKQECQCAGFQSWRSSRETSGGHMFQRVKPLNFPKEITGNRIAGQRCAFENAVSEALGKHSMEGRRLFRS